MKVEIELLREKFLELVTPSIHETDEESAVHAAFDRACVIALAIELEGGVVQHHQQAPQDPKEKFRQRGLKAAETRKRNKSNSALHEEAQGEGA